MPDGFIRTQDLDRSVLDFGQFEIPRRLPLLCDLLERAYQHSDADYVIYSNVDIALMPHFYQTVARHLEIENSALIINRRTIPDTYTDLHDLPLMFAQLGQPHPGYDCFVFPRQAIPNLDVGKICIGANRIGLAFVLALHVECKPLTLLADSHMTFHIGDDQRWQNPKFMDYAAYNEAEINAVINRLEARHGEFDSGLPSWAFNAITAIKQGKKPDKAPQNLSRRILQRIKNMI